MSSFRRREDGFAGWAVDDDASVRSINSSRSLPASRSYASSTRSGRYNQHQNHNAVHSSVASSSQSVNFREFPPSQRPMRPASFTARDNGSVRSNNSARSAPARQAPSRPIPYNQNRSTVRSVSQQVNLKDPRTYPSSVSVGSSQATVPQSNIVHHMARSSSSPAANYNYNYRNGSQRGSQRTRDTPSVASRNSQASAQASTAEEREKLRRRSQCWLGFFVLVALACAGAFGVGIYVTTMRDNNDAKANQPTPNPVFSEIEPVPPPLPTNSVTPSPTNRPTFSSTNTPTLSITENTLTPTITVSSPPVSTSLPTIPTPSPSQSTPTPTVSTPPPTKATPSPIAPTPPPTVSTLSPTISTKAPTVAATTTTPTFLPTLSPSESVGVTPLLFNDDFEDFLLNQSAEDEFFWIEFLNYRDQAIYNDENEESTKTGREADEIYQNWIENDILPSLMNNNATEKYYVSDFRDPYYEKMIIIKYPSGREFYDFVWKSPNFSSMIRHRQAGLLLPSDTANDSVIGENKNGIKYSQMMATKLLSDITEVPAEMQQPPATLSDNDDPFFFLHLMEYNEIAAYPGQEKETMSGYEAMKVFDIESAPLKSRYDIRAAGWFSVAVPSVLTSSSIHNNNALVKYDEVRLEYVPSLAQWGLLVGGNPDTVPQIWLNRQAALVTSTSVTAMLGSPNAVELPNWYNNDIAPTDAPTRITSSPTATATLPPLPLSNFFNAGLRNFLLQSSADEEFYWIEVLKYRDEAVYGSSSTTIMEGTGRNADQVYKDWIKKEVLPLINQDENNKENPAKLIHQATIGGIYDEILIIRYPSGRSFYDYVWNSPFFQEMIQHREAGVVLTEAEGAANDYKPSLMMATKLVADETVQDILQQFISSSSLITKNNESNPSEFLFLHLLEFLDIASYEEESETQITGREAMKMFDEDSAPLKARYGIRPAGWFDVIVSTTVTASMSATRMKYDQLRLEYVPSFQDWGLLLGGEYADQVPAIWANRNAALDAETSVSVVLDSPDGELPNLYDGNR